MTIRKHGVAALARRLRVPITRKALPDWLWQPWDGRALHLRGESESNLFHDLAHYQISAPSRRRRAEFGSVTDEEALASFLGIAWEHEYLGWRAAHKTAIEHGWIDEPASPWDMVCIAAKLEAMGFIRHGRPVARLRGKRERLARLPR